MLVFRIICHSLLGIETKEQRLSCLSKYLEADTISFELLSLLLLYCFVTNYHKISILKHSSIHSQFCGAEVQTDLSRFPTRVLQSPPEVWVTGLFSEGPGEEFAPSLIQVVGWIQSLAIVGLRFLFPLLAVWWGVVFAPRDHLYSFSQGSSIFRSVSEASPLPSFTSF